LTATPTHPGGGRRHLPDPGPQHPDRPCRTGVPICSRVQSRAAVRRPSPGPAFYPRSHFPHSGQDMLFVSNSHPGAPEEDRDGGVPPGGARGCTPPDVGPGAFTRARPPRGGYDHPRRRRGGPRGGDADDNGRKGTAGRYAAFRTAWTPRSSGARSLRRSPSAARHAGTPHSLDTGVRISESAATAPADRWWRGPVA
jgi:hypothetical protein